jgi:hypothetical protein
MSREFQYPERWLWPPGLYEEVVVRGEGPDPARVTDEVERFISNLVVMNAKRGNEWACEILDEAAARVAARSAR